jgi:hypothetical protein
LEQLYALVDGGHAVNQGRRFVLRAIVDNQ